MTDISRRERRLQGREGHTWSVRGTPGCVWHSTRGPRCHWAFWWGHLGPLTPFRGRGQLPNWIRLLAGRGPLPSSLLCHRAGTPATDPTDLFPCDRYVYCNGHQGGTSCSIIYVFLVLTRVIHGDNDKTCSGPGEIGRKNTKRRRLGLHDPQLVVELPSENWRRRSDLKRLS